MLVVFLLFSLCARSIHAQDAAQKPSEKPAEKKAEKAVPPEKAENPAQIELLETRYRFETNGDSRKEVHARAHINTELGVRQFARLNFDYNRSFQSVEIPLVHITHPSGGTADILPSAITDNPNPAVINAAAYQDVRVKSVRILGLEPGDTLEYRVTTTTTHHPLAPDFWFQHTFDRTGIVLREDLTLELPPGRGYVEVNPEMPGATMTGPGGGYTYHLLREQGAAASHPADEPKRPPDISASTFATDVELSARLANLFYSGKAPSPVVAAKAHELTEGAKDGEERLRLLYAFVSKSIATVDLPIGATGFRTRTPEEILKSSVATSEDKATLLIALVASVANFQPTVCLAPEHDLPPPFYSLPMQIQHVLLGVTEGVFDKPIWLDPAVEVAPFGMISSAYRGKTVLCIPKSKLERGLGFWERVPEEIPFAASQYVNVVATLGADGKLSAKVHYSLRGDNELLLRVGFHQTPKDKWKELAQLLSISDGFRGQVTSVNASDPYATREPFTLDYEITMPKFVDWSKKPVRIPALLPQLGLPDPPAKPVAGAATSPIELGTPLEVETHMTLHLPPGTTAQMPTGTSVQRDYATYASQYSAKGVSISASRHINFLLREIPAARAVDYNSFLRAVQSDEAQDFTLVREEGTTPEKKPSAPKSPTPTQAAAAQPKP
jgi:hypothetical protein